MSSYHHSTFPQPEGDTFPPKSANYQQKSATIGRSQSSAGYTIQDSHEQFLTPSELSNAKHRPPSNGKVKHRRTRNGCYTCRSRRVKCDEQHPVCERCKKGNRECNYPEHRPNAKRSGKLKQERPQKISASDSSSNPNEDDEEAGLEYDATKLISNDSCNSSEAISKGEEMKKYARQSLDNMRLDTMAANSEDTLSPSTELSRSSISAFSNETSGFSSVSTSISPEIKPWSHLPQDLQYYLYYHQKHLSFHHYFFKHEADHFLHTILIEQALMYDPLLNAIVGFAAFHHAVNRHKGQIQDFLEYYNKSVSLLRKSLASDHPYTDGTILTILQLATFEEYLGDYVSLLSHQQAAFQMLLDLYTSSSILDSELRRRILAWYLRFDLYGSIISGHETLAGRRWFMALAEYYHGKVSAFPENIDFKIEAAISDLWIVSTDMAQLFARFARGDLPLEVFNSECDAFGELIDAWKDRLDPVFGDNQYLVRSFDGKAKDPDDIVDPYQPGGLYSAPLTTFNFMVADWLAIRAMFRYKKALALQEDPPSDLSALALELCRIFEAIEYSAELPPEAVLKAHASLGVASLFLPKDDRHTMWCRRKMAKIESLGHVYPATFRRRMAALWNDPEIHHWWLPNEEAYPPVVRSVRSLMGDRLGDKDSGQRSKEQRDMRGIFAAMILKEVDQA